MQIEQPRFASITQSMEFASGSSANRTIHTWQKSSKIIKHPLISRLRISPFSKDCLFACFLHVLFPRLWISTLQNSLCIFFTFVSGCCCPEGYADRNLNTFWYTLNLFERNVNEMWTQRLHQRKFHFRAFLYTILWTIDLWRTDYIIMCVYIYIHIIPLGIHLKGWGVWFYGYIIRTPKL